MQNKRKERIYSKLQQFIRDGVIQDDLVIQNQMPGIRWTFTPCGYSTRAMSTNDVEWFIIGVEASHNALKSHVKLSIV
jgi:hypothetical protein